MILTLLLVQRRRPRRRRRDGHQRRPRRRLPRLHQRRVLSESGPSAMSHGTPSIVPVQAAMPATPQLGQRPRQRAGARRAPCRAVPRRFEGSRERWVRSGRAADPAPLPPMKPRTSRPRKPLARGHSAWGRPAAGRPLIRSIDAHSLPHRVAKFALRCRMLCGTACMGSWSRARRPPQRGVRRPWWSRYRRRTAARTILFPVQRFP
jgi:hypothetical protein